MLAAVVGESALGRADALSPDELGRLEAGQVVSRRVEADLAAGPYAGGVSYAIVHAPPAEVMAALLDTSAYTEILPLTLEAHEVARRGGDRLVLFRHGTRIASAVYTARVRRVSPGLVRFWMEPSEPHDFDDAFGYFRVEPAGPGATLLTYGAVIDLGLGLTRLLFEERVCRRALETPALVKRYVERRAARPLAGRAASRVAVAW